VSHHHQKWALVTGASSGIGREYCLQLATQGFSIVMVARRELLLIELSKYLEKEYKVQTLILVFDLCLEKNLYAIHAEIVRRKITIKLLVNNAGVGYWGPFLENKIKNHIQLIQLNIIAPVVLSHLYLNDFKNKDGGNIINISSPACFQPIPYMSVYGASKSFIQNFSLSLLGENLTNKNIFIQTVLPEPTETEFLFENSEHLKKIFKDWNPANILVRASLEGLENKRPLISLTKKIYIQKFFADFFPVKFILARIGQMFKPL
jgi:short-subunit dehydrogenase